MSQIPSAAASTPPTQTSFEPDPIGRPHGYSEAIVKDLRRVIVELGLCDSSAARYIGLSPSTLSRWKQERPELKLVLYHARQECRAHHFQQLRQAGQSGRAGSWRASAWILQHLFPADFAPRASERQKFAEMEERALGLTEEDIVDMSNA